MRNAVVGFVKSIAILAVVCAVHARADEAEPPPPPTRAETLFADALKAQDEGRQSEACDAFRASAEASESVGAVLNVAHCSAREGAYERSRAEFQRVLVLNEMTADPVRKERVKQAAERGIADAASRFGTLSVVVEPAGAAVVVSIGGGVAVKPGEPLSLEVGSYVVEVSAPGFERTLRAARVRARQEEVVRVSLVPEAVPTAQATATPIGAVVLISAGAASAILGSVFVALASDRAALIRDECGPNVAPPSCPQGDPARADMLATEGAVFEGTGIALLATGGTATVAGIVLAALGSTPSVDQTAARVGAGFSASNEGIGIWVAGDF